jgi:hypothetical protein
MYRLPHYTDIGPRYGDWMSHAMSSHMVVETDTAPKEEDDRKLSAPEGDTDSKDTANDEGVTDRKRPDPDGDDDNCYMIHLPTQLENEIGATVVNRRHFNDHFYIENNHFLKLDGGSDISILKDLRAFSVLKHARH